VSDLQYLDKTLREVGERLKGARKAQGWSVREVAARSGVSERFVFQIEKGQANVSLKTLGSLAEVFGWSLGTLFSGGVGSADQDLCFENRSTFEPIAARLAACSESELLNIKNQIESILSKTSASQPSVHLLALLGMKGAGKSTVGQLLSEALQVPFLELDARIESLAGLPLSDIFSLHGEEYYEELQAVALRSLVHASERAIVATGGGIVSSPRALQLLERHSLRVWLKASPQMHWARVVAKGDRRPIDGFPRAYEQLCHTWENRAPLYAQSDWTIDTESRPPAEIAQEIFLMIQQSGRFGVQNAEHGFNIKRA
jgi:XRE family aerobic/anaerobic benzoate catabolism transcriptional regulator